MLRWHEDGTMLTVAEYDLGSYQAMFYVYDVC